MIEVTDEIITRFETILHDNVGYAASRNADRILADLVKQAEITEKPSSEIPVAVKFHVVATAEGQLNLVLDDVSWKVLSRSKDDNFYTVGIDPKQPNLPGFDQPEPKPKPVVDVKALPEHEDDANDAGGFDDELSELFKECCPKDLRKSILQNLQKAGDEMIMIVVMPTLDDRHVVKYLDDVWSKELVPNEMKVLEQLDDGEHIVFGLDGELTKTTKAKLLKKGYGILSVGRLLDRRLVLMKAKNSSAFDVIFDVADDLDGRFNFFEKLAQMIKEDDALIMNEAEFYEYKAK